MNDEPLAVAAASNADASSVEPPAGRTKEAAKAVPKDATGSPASQTSKAEFGGPKGLEPTRYGDWERNGRCYDF